jgi:glutathione S-transferase
MDSRGRISLLQIRLWKRHYLADELSLADIAHAGNFVRLRKLEERGEVSLDEYPDVGAWIERLESRESYEAAVCESYRRSEPEPCAILSTPP